jgi:hypothetical protein
MLFLIFFEFEFDLFYIFFVQCCLFRCSTNSNVHYIGWLMHGKDFRKGSGGFFAGFRYLIRDLISHFREIDFGIAFPSLLLSQDNAISHIVKRVQVADDLIVMQGY